MPLFGTRGAASVTGFGGLAKLGYLLRNSLRFRASNSAYLNRTPASAGNRKTWTWSGWFKRGNLSQTNGSAIFNQGGVSSNYTLARFDSSDRLNFESYGASSYNFQKTSTAVYRDTAAWYHIVFVLDATNTQARIYVNGSEVTYTTNTNPANADQPFNQAALNRIGYTTDNIMPFDGYLAEVNFVDGQALTPSSFGKTDPATGQWIPIKFGGAYGTNGFYLPFTNTTSTSTLGNDFSGNSNTWTVNNISLTAGATYDSMTDVPTLTSATASNFCTWNPLRPSSYGACAIADGNLKASQSASAYVSATSTFAMPNGKWYWEITCSSIGFVTSIGITNTVTANGAGATGAYSYHYDGSKYVNGSNSAYGASYTSGDVLGFAYDADAGSLTCYKNGTSQGVLASGLTPTDFYIWATLYGSWNIALNCGQQPFAYTPPTGFVALNTFNI